MVIFKDEQIKSALGYNALIAALKEIFRSDYEMPLRHHHFYENAEHAQNALILMPVWNSEFMGVKQVVVAPLNYKKNLPAIHAFYTLMDANTGEQLAIMNAAELTARRTACTSALAAAYLAPENAKNLLVIGGGKVARHLIPAHKTVRSYDEIQVWMRDETKLAAFVAQLTQDGHAVKAVTDLERAVRQADVISCATLSPTPVIKGEWLKSGTHLDLIGSHKPDTREADDEAILKSTIYVDSRMGALHETGELAIPIATGILKETDVAADIAELCRGIHPGRENEDEITLFKSAGLAIEDLAAALLVYRSVQDK
jgi:ornithine cyclodeaminase/alanine dehydrogenase-like protein (mu-crystallin family)